MKSQSPISVEAVRWAYRLFLNREPESDEAIEKKLALNSYAELRGDFIKSEEFSSQISVEAIHWAYRLFLDRLPEDVAEVEKKLSLNSYAELRSQFIRAEEFKRNNSRNIALDGTEPPLEVESITNEKDLNRLLKHIGSVWKKLGETEPHWSVLTEEGFKQENLSNTKKDFYNSSRANIERLFKTLERNAVDTSQLKTCLEYGCGVGRLTRWLAPHFETVYGYDISQPHLDCAKDYFAASNINNVEFCQVSQIDDLNKFPPVDLIYTMIVLQHNPPPIIALILEGLMQALNPGGVALFQIPTYQSGYRFTLDSYLKGEAKEKRMELHLLPQREIFDIVYRNNGQVLEVLEDNWIGTNYKELSNTFLIQKAR